MVSWVLLPSPNIVPVISHSNFTKWKFSVPIGRYEQNNKNNKSFQSKTVRLRQKNFPSKEIPKNYEVLKDMKEEKYESERK